MEHEQEDGIRVLMTMGTTETTEAIGEQSNTGGEVIGLGAAPEASNTTIVAPSTIAGAPPPPLWPLLLEDQ